jgi:hypothetical protein
MSAPTIDTTKQPDPADEFGMRLPAGKTCGDCKHYEYCADLFDCRAANTVCDWAPHRFVQSTMIRSVIDRVSAKEE